MEQNGNKSEAIESRETLYLMGGLALMVLGAGLVMTHPSVRNAVRAGLSGVLPDLQNKFMPDLAGLGPDIERYLKLRSM
ncbi:MAG TPA: hypothetical protein VJ302_30790 [Blastocatellia bacterium]|nr:hypothetical protein [Blastocatellia bacterium]